MNPDPTRRLTGLSRVGIFFASTLFLVICLGPHLDRLRHPSLFTDDVTRIADLQSKPLSSLLFRPFQEHMAPFFETVSWITWNLAGQKLTNAPVAFTLMSYVPFVLCLWQLGLLIRREMDSTTTALVAVAGFSLSSLHSEVIYWYSASSFTWALFWTLLTLRCSGEAASSGRRSATIWSAVFAILAPASSAIGLLAGPLGVIRGLAGVEQPSTWRRRLESLMPMAGSLSYLAICAGFKYQDVLKSSVETRSDLGSGMIYVVCATINVLVPGIVGLNNIELAEAPRLSLALAMLGLGGILTWAWRSRPHRALILGGLWLILGGYFMTYCFRTQRFGVSWLFRVERYHLFPMLGFTLLVALALRRYLARHDRSPSTGLMVATGIAALLMATHLPGILLHSRYYRFPNQSQTLAALGRLDSACVREQITRDQARAALRPIVMKWSQFDYLILLKPSVVTSGMPDSMVRQALLSSISQADREALWGGVDVSACLMAGDPRPRATPLSVGRLVDSYPGPGGTPNRGTRPYFEFELPDPASDGHRPPGNESLCIPGGDPGSLMELWWADKPGEWSESRSLRWQVKQPGEVRSWSVSLDRLPHWEPGKVRRVRILPPNTRQASLEAPRIVR